MISEVFLETIYRHHVQERRKNVPQGRSCPSPLEYMDSLFRSQFPCTGTHFLILVKRWFPMAPLRCGGARARLGRACHRHETGFSSWSFFVPCHRTHWKPTVVICLPAPPGLGSARTARRRHQRLLNLISSLLRARLARKHGTCTVVGRQNPMRSRT